VSKTYLSTIAASVSSFWQLLSVHRVTTRLLGFRLSPQDASQLGDVFPPSV